MLIPISIILLIAIDAAIKYYIEHRDNSFFPKEIFNGAITLHRSFNQGMAMGFLKKHPLIVKWIPALLVPILTIYYIPEFLKKSNILLKISGILTISGGFGNLSDRFLKGKVTDYFSLPIKKIRHVIFNLSDIYIFLGGALLILAALLKKESG